MNEKEIEKLILEYLNLRGIFCWKNNSTGVYDPTKKTFRKNRGKYLINGVSDILGILPGGRFLAIEVKTPKTKTRASEAQKLFIDNINRKGGFAFIAWSIECVKNEFEGIL